MMKSIARYAATWIIIVILSYSYGCILSPQEDPAPPDDPVDPVEYMDLTEKEHVITNLVLSYQEKYMPEFEKLLLDKENDTYNGVPYTDSYYWYNQPEAVGTEEYLLRDQEITVTTNMFKAANQDPNAGHQAIDDLSLDITAGSWSPISEIFGQPCEDCWFTEREYQIEVIYGPDKIVGYDNVQFYIVPVDQGDITIYKIAIAKDILAN